MAWYQSEGWKPWIADLIQRRGGACALCPSTERLNGHHKRDPFPDRSTARLLDEGNVVVLCHAHHRAVHGTQTTTVCETCGAEIYHVPSKVRRFCNMTCRDKHPDFAAMAPRNCLECGNEFQPAHPSTVRCGVECAAKHTAAIKMSRRPVFTCAVCPIVFSVPPSRARAIAKQALPPCCSLECAGKLRARHS